MVRRTERRFPVILEPGSDELLVHFAKKGKVIEWFKINYRAMIRDRWIEVVRYDMAHGYLHVHRFWLPPGRRIRALEDPKNRRLTYNESLTSAREDLRKNWMRYRLLMENAAKRDDANEDETDEEGPAP